MIIGVDPGALGAWALYDPASGRITTFPMPTTTMTVKGKTRTRVDLPQTLALARALVALGAWRARVEQVGGIMGQSASASFTFGWAACAAHAALVAAGIKPETVAAQTWKRALDVTRDKDASRARAAEIFPEDAAQWRLAKLDGHAEAALIAYWDFVHGGSRDDASGSDVAESRNRRVRGRGGGFAV